MTITPKDWGTFQHYKTRSPPWIKLHRRLLDNFDFARLPVASRALAPMLWILASEYEGGRITATLEEMAFRFRTSVDELSSALTPLIDRGFFIASGSLAVRKQCASGSQATSLSRDRGETEGEAYPSEDSLSSEEGMWQ
jgi:hypothetical protein